MTQIERVDLPDAFWFQEGPGLRKWQFTTSGIKILNVGNIMPDGSIDLSRTDRHISNEEFEQRYTHFGVDAGDLVMASSGISFEDDGFLRTKIAFVDEGHLPLCMNTSTIRFKAIDGVSCLEYLRHWLQSVEFRRQVSRLVTGTAQLNFGPGHLKQMTIGLPPIDEQRRIAGILDAADALRRRRREALALLDTLPGAIFAEMFGDISGLPYVQFGNVIHDIGNGVSPSRAGTVEDEVLTLAAVTGFSFNASKRKIDKFAAEISPEKRVEVGDFLLCRGNGNPGLVGAGKLADETGQGFVYPDTIMRAKLNGARVVPGYIASLWKHDHIRDQISAGARTTNGTMKINQTTVKNIEIPLPDLDLQAEFARRASSIENGIKAQQSVHLRELETLFASLQSRAFAGAL